MLVKFFAYVIVIGRSIKFILLSSSMLTSSEYLPESNLKIVNVLIDNTKLSAKNVCKIYHKYNSDGVYVLRIYQLFCRLNQQKVQMFG